MYTLLKGRQLESLIHTDVDIYYVPCKVYPSDDNPWIKPCLLGKDYFKGNYKEQMRKFKNAFAFHADSETGLKPRFYIKD